MMVIILAVTPLLLFSFLFYYFSKHYPCSYRIYRLERMQILNKQIESIEEELVSAKVLSNPRFIYLNCCLNDCYKELNNL